MRAVRYVGPRKPLRLDEVPKPDHAADALAASQPVREFCAVRFKDYQFGLKLIAQNSGRTDFLIDTDAVREPDKVLSQWVVNSYRETEPPPGEAPASAAPA